MGKTPRRLLQFSGQERAVAWPMVAAMGLARRGPITFKVELTGFTSRSAVRRERERWVQVK